MDPFSVIFRDGFRHMFVPCSTCLIVLIANCNLIANLVVCHASFELTGTPEDQMIVEQTFFTNKNIHISTLFCGLRVWGQFLSVFGSLCFSVSRRCILGCKLMFPVRRVNRTCEKTGVTMQKKGSTS